MPRTFVARVAAIAPDFIFSFYYRRMLSPALLATARRGAFNMHGSLLPQYRGRAPVNWAVLNGEAETGATLHEMVAKPDAGDIVDAASACRSARTTPRARCSARSTLAAERAARRVLPSLLAGDRAADPQDLAAGSLLRRPHARGRAHRLERDRAREIHDLVRAVAPPYPGAFPRLARAASRAAHAARSTRARMPAPPSRRDLRRRRRALRRAPATDAASRCSTPTATARVHRCGAARSALQRRLVQFGLLLKASSP